MSNECVNFSNTLKVGSCGTRLWLGTATTLGTEMLVVTYYLGGDEVSDFFYPIIEGEDIYLDLQEPYPDYYNSFNTYYINLTDATGYYSDGISITNNGTTHSGFIVNFSSAKNEDDRLVVV